MDNRLRHFTGGDGEPLNDPSKLACFLFPKEGGWVAHCDLRWMQDLIPAVAFRRWRDAVFEGRSDNVSDGLSLRSQAAIGPCSLSIA